MRWPTNGARILQIQEDGSPPPKGEFVVIPSIGAGVLFAAIAFVCAG